MIYAVGILGVLCVGLSIVCIVLVGEVRRLRGDINFLHDSNRAFSRFLIAESVAGQAVTVSKGRIGLKRIK